MTTKTKADGHGPVQDLDDDGHAPPIFCGPGDVVADLNAMSD